MTDTTRLAQLQSRREDIDNQIARELLVTALEKVLGEHSSAFGEAFKSLAGVKIPVTPPKISKSSEKRVVRAYKKKKHALYANPNSNPLQTWTGHGRAPNWVKSYEESGKSREDLLVGRVAA